MVTLTRLRTVRERVPLTQQELADLAGINRVTLVRIEAGQEEPFPRTIRKLAKALRVNPADLMDPLPE
jgi:transcriptional regulator with XRE-family HTH domain